MTVALPKHSVYGKLLDSIPGRVVMPLFRAGCCVGLAVCFLLFWVKSGGLTLGFSSLRSWLPLGIPLVALIAAIPMAAGIKNRLDIYERGLVYHTLWFELEAAWENVVDLRLETERPSAASGYGGGVRNGPVLALHICFREDRPWVFRSNAYQAQPLATKGEALVTRFHQTPS